MAKVTKRTSAEDMTSIAVEATPHLLKALGASKNLVKPICKALKSVDCKDQNALIRAINAQGTECAKISGRYVKMLNEVILNRDEVTRKPEGRKSTAKTALSLLGTGAGLAGGAMGVAMTFFMHKFTKAFSAEMEKNPFGDDT